MNSTRASINIENKCFRASTDQVCLISGTNEEISQTVVSILQLLSEHKPIGEIHNYNPESVERPSHPSTDVHDIPMFLRPWEAEIGQKWRREMQQSMYLNDVGQHAMHPNSGNQTQRDAQQTPLPHGGYRMGGVRQQIPLPFGEYQM